MMISISGIVGLTYALSFNAYSFHASNRVLYFSISSQARDDGKVM